MQNYLAPEVLSQESAQGQCSIILWVTYTCDLVTYLAKMLFYGQKWQVSAQEQCRIILWVTHIFDLVTYLPIYAN